MRKYNKIKAIFFLGIFSIFLLHQMLPHWHQEHEVEQTYKAVAHSNSHGHHHNVPEKESPYKGFLDLFLEMHVHSEAVNENLLIHLSSLKRLDVKKDINKLVSIVQRSISTSCNETDKVKVYYPPNTNFYYYLSSLDSRGPPYLS